jgi:hypothetical protein
MVEANVPRKSASNRLIMSQALQVIFEFFDYSEQIKMQALNKRFYNSFCPGIVKRVSLYNLGNVSMGVVVFPGLDYINVLMPSDRPDSLCQWHEKAAKLKVTPDIFRKSVKEQDQLQKLKWPLWPKIV